MNVYQTAINAQNAVNLSGLAHTLGSMMPKTFRRVESRLRGQNVTESFWTDLRKKWTSVDEKPNSESE